MASAFTLSSGTSTKQMADDGSVVLGLEGSDGEKAASLTTALRGELAKRGSTTSQDMTLEELKLTMGCEDGDLKCIAEGGKSLGTSELIYGKIDGAAGEYTLTLTVLDVEKARVVNGLTTTIDASDLDSDKIGATAADLVNRLLGPADSSAAVPFTDSESSDDPSSDDPTEADDPADTGAEAKKKGGLVFGMEKPPERWKVIGLGVSGGLLLASAGTAIASTLLIRPNGKLYNDLIGAAEDSLTDSNARNDIAPDTEGDLCELARAEPDDQPGKVTNADMTQICNKADTFETVALAGWIGTGVFAASSAAFAVLLFTHKADESEATARVRKKMQKHDVQLGYTPRREGGFMFGGGLRF